MRCIMGQAKHAPTIPANRLHSRECANVAPPTRRAALACVLTLPALAGEPHPDAELLDLWRRRGLAEEAADQSGKRLDALSDATPFPKPPEALFVQVGDEAFGFLGVASPHGSGRLWYSIQAPGAGGRAGRLRGRQTRIVYEPFPAGPALPGVDEVIGRRVPWPEAQARADAIVAAWDGWKAELDRIYAASGAEAANAEWEALDDARAELDGAIRDTTARTLDGLRVKAQLAQLDLDEGVQPDAILHAGLVRDILAMQAHT